MQPFFLVLGSSPQAQRICVYIREQADIFAVQRSLLFSFLL